MSQDTPDHITIDPHVRAATGRRLNLVLAEIASHTKKIEELHAEMFTLHQQYLCYPHDWKVDQSSYMWSTDKCTKCGATHVA